MRFGKDVYGICAAYLKSLAPNKCISLEIHDHEPPDNFCFGTPLRRRPYFSQFPSRKPKNHPGFAHIKVVHHINVVHDDLDPLGLS